MGKRFTDTDLWEKDWFMELEIQDKLAIIYIKDKCDCIGLWKPNKKLAEFLIGSYPDWETLPSRCNGNIVILENGKWWLSDFCDFQYGCLTEKCPPHKKYIETLKRNGLFERVVKGYSKGIKTLQEKEKEKEKEKDQEKEGVDKKKDKVKITEFVALTAKEKEKLISKYGAENTEKIIAKLDAYKGSTGKTYKDDYRAILNWVADEVLNGKGTKPQRTYL